MSNPQLQNIRPPSEDAKRIRKALKIWAFALSYSPALSLDFSKLELAVIAQQAKQKEPKNG